MNTEMNWFGFPCGDRFVFEFSDEAAARSFFDDYISTVLTILQNWGCSIATARYPGHHDVNFPIATISAFCPKSGQQ